MPNAASVFIPRLAPVTRASHEWRSCQPYRRSPAHLSILPAWRSAFRFLLETKHSLIQLRKPIWAQPGTPAPGSLIPHPNRPKAPLLPRAQAFRAGQSASWSDARFASVNFAMLYSLLRQPCSTGVNKSRD